MDISKLSKKYRDYIISLENRVRELERALSVFAGKTVSKVELVNYRTGLNSHIPENSIIKFNFTPNSWIEVKLMEGGIQIIGSDQIDISPMSSNLVHIKIK